jgi:hypothetical protein
VVWLIVSLGAALVGGWLCARIAKGGRAVQVLAGLLLILGIISAVGERMMAQSEAAAPVVREADINSMEAMMSAQSPAWVSFANPLLGMVGVLIGGWIARKSGSSPGVGGASLG